MSFATSLIAGYISSHWSSPFSFIFSLAAFKSCITSSLSPSCAFSKKNIVSIKYDLIWLHALSTIIAGINIPSTGLKSTSSTPASDKIVNINIIKETVPRKLHIIILYFFILRFVLLSIPCLQAYNFSHLLLNVSVYKIRIPDTFQKLLYIFFMYISINSCF